MGCLGRPGRCVQGFTLPEILVAAVMLLALLGCTSLAVVAGTRIYQRGSIRAELQQTAVFSLQRLIRDLDRSSAAGLTFGDSRLAMIPLADVTAEGRRAWARRVVMYWRAPEGKLWRGCWLEVPGVAFSGELPGHLPAAVLAVLPSAPARERVLLSADAASFEASLGSGGTHPIHLRLVLERALSSTQTERFELRRAWGPRTPST